MTKENKQKAYTIALMICTGLIIGSIPVELLFDNSYLVNIIKAILKLTAIIVVILYIKKEKLDFNKKNKYKWLDLAFIPILLISISNYFVCWFNQINLNNNFDLKLLLTQIALTIFTVILEEIMFRLIVITELQKHHHKWKTILYSSLIFSGIHLLNISSLASIGPVLIQAGYTFFLGFFLGMIYYHTHNYLYPIILHFAFNFFNNDLISHLYSLKWDLSFFIINILVGLIVIVYTYLLSNFLSRKDDSNASQSMDF